MNYYCISDIHGCLKEFKSLLELWNPKKETLVLLGDYIDRGPNSLEVVRHIISLKNKYGDRVQVIYGNHDKALASFAYFGEENTGLYSRQFETTILEAFEGDNKLFKKSSRRQKASKIKRAGRDVVSFLFHLPAYYETEHMIFIHAGYDLNAGDWKNTRTDVMCSIREDFYLSEIVAPKRTFFGHTVVTEIDPLETCVWISPKGDKVGIDGGCVFGGTLNGVKVSETGDILEVIQIPFHKDENYIAHQEKSILEALAALDIEEKKLAERRELLLNNLENIRSN